MNNLSPKRLFDISFSLFGILISLPLWCLIVISIYLEDRRPIYYLQERVGKNGHIFMVIKFRSMVPNAEQVTGPIQAKENDNRITKVGALLRKTAMDELPQLINILNGDMSFVGPRALRPSEVENVSGAATDLVHRRDANARHLVVPGLTGVAQVFAPCDASIEKKIKYDMWYIKNRTFYVDMWLIFISFLVTFCGKWETRQNKFDFLKEEKFFAKTEKDAYEIRKV